MGRLEDRLARIEAAADAARGHTIPVHVRILLKHIAREQARDAGEEPPPYTGDEIRAMYESDVADAAGEGCAAEYRQGEGWQGPLEHRLLDIWEAQALKRVEMAEHLPLAEIYGVRDDVPDELDEEEAFIMEQLVKNPHDYSEEGE